jgi:hypothetical protein
VSRSWCGVNVDGKKSDEEAKKKQIKVDGKCDILCPEISCRRLNVWLAGLSGQRFLFDYGVDGMSFI